MTALTCGPELLHASDETAARASGDHPTSQITVRESPIHTTPIQMDVNMVVVNITVTDPYGGIT